MALEDVKEWLYGCSHCGTCKEVLRIFSPSCPAGEKYQLESYFPSGQVFIARAVSQGLMSLDDEEIRQRLYSCTGCLSCQKQCGVYHHDHIFEIVQALRTEAVTRGLLSPGYMMMYYGLRKDDNVFGEPKEQRGRWADGLDVKLATQEKVDVLYHTGCLLSYDRELQTVPRSVINTFTQAGINIGIMGREETCCGGHSYETGFTGEFTKYGQHSIETFNTLDIEEVITSCADCYATFQRLYLDLGKEMKFKVLHVGQYLDTLLAEGKVRAAAKVDMKVTYHDPCHLGRHMGENAIYEEPRRVLASIPGLTLLEMERNRDNAWCCGAGAGVKQADPELAIWTAGERLKEAISTGAEALVSSCPWCERNFKDAANEYGLNFPVYDIAEIFSYSL